MSRLSLSRSRSGTKGRSGSQSTSSTSSPSPKRPPARPKFHHQNTSDRLRESLDRPPSFSSMSSINVKRHRRSVFLEVGLEDADAQQTPQPPGQAPWQEQATASSPPGVDHARRTTSLGTEGTANDRSRRSASSGNNKEGVQNDVDSPVSPGGRDQPASASSSPSSPSRYPTRPWYTRLAVSGKINRERERPKVKPVASAPSLSLFLPRKVSTGGALDS
ncbi:hypothetical protein VTK73DRAFT_9653 [Phialemonium thermophilum]|uniref:Uncharacterized protein n=1 Tax=Phialemonium thermophilum TaxID=223376 RepID=A0ABR3W123_9PEZI